MFNNKSGNILKTVLIIILIIVMLTAMFYAVIDGIIGRVVEFVANLVENIGGGLNSAFAWVKKKLNIDYLEQSMSVVKIDDDTVKNLKNNLETAAIDTKKSGLTEVRLRKILLAHSISTSLSDTLIIVPVTEEEIIANVKEKDESIENIGDAKNYLQKKDSKGIWPVDEPKYDLYYDSDVFFYFQDEDNKFEDGNEQWFLGAMGAVKILDENGTSFKSYSEVTYEEAKNNYINDPNDTNKNRLLSSYVKVDSDTIKVPRIIENQKKYKYDLKRNDTSVFSEPYEGAYSEPKITVEQVEVNISQTIDTTTYQIPIELMIDLLDITGSGHFLEEFIDNAVEQISVTVKGYPLVSETVTYSGKQYNISDGFVAEAFDMTPGDTDILEDNFRAYKRIIYDRQKWNEEGTFEGTVSKQEGFDELNYNENPDSLFSADKKFSTDYLKAYLELAYEPAEAFNLRRSKSHRNRNRNSKRNKCTICNK